MDADDVAEPRLCCGVLRDDGVARLASSLMARLLRLGVLGDVLKGRAVPRPSQTLASSITYGRPATCMVQPWKHHSSPPSSELSLSVAIGRLEHHSQH
eukprot:scaffold267374_cov14-Prasinocladus_malaysianus.AAC.1